MTRSASRSAASGWPRPARGRGTARATQRLWRGEECRKARRQRSRRKRGLRHHPSRLVGIAERARAIEALVIVGGLRIGNRGSPCRPMTAELGDSRGSRRAPMHSEWAPRPRQLHRQIVKKGRRLSASMPLRRWIRIADLSRHPRAAPAAHRASRGLSIRPGSCAGAGGMTALRIMRAPWLPPVTSRREQARGSGIGRGA